MYINLSWTSHESRESRAEDGERGYARGEGRREKFRNCTQQTLWSCLLNGLQMEEGGCWQVAGGSFRGRLGGRKERRGEERGGEERRGEVR